jgi:uncharacterized protein YndB with AHSA1/START domain
MSKKNIKKQPSPKPKKSSKVSVKKTAAKPTTKKNATKTVELKSVKTVKKAPIKNTAKKATINNKVKKETNNKIAVKNKIAPKKAAKKPTPKISKPALSSKKVTPTTSRPKINKNKKTVEVKPILQTVKVNPAKKTETTKEKKAIVTKTATKKLEKNNNKPVNVPAKDQKIKSVLSSTSPKAIKIQKQKEQQVKEVTVKTKSVTEPKGKFELEYVIHSSPVILFEFLVSPSGLSEWFCDDVNIRNDLFTFFWDGTQQIAKLVKIIEEKLIRFEWVEKADGSYFEFRIEKDELTNDISLIVTDFAENDEEKKSSNLLWDSQIDKLLHVLGSYF